VAFVSSELFRSGDDCESLAISQENRALNWGYKNKAIAAVIDVQIGSDVK
jgi:hypothetical protein